MKRLPFLILLLVAPLLRAAETAVPVVQESHHATVLENPQLRVLDVQIPVGATTRYHIHDVPSVIVYLTKSTNRSQTLGQTTTTPRDTTPGDSRYAPYDQQPLTHRVTNPGPAPFRVFDIELLKPPSANSPAPLTGPNVQLQWEEKLARSYKLTLSPGVRLEFPSGNGYLAVGISGRPAVISRYNDQHPLPAGEFSYRAPGEALPIINTGVVPAEVVLLQLR
jgi:hypothetical protein